MKTFEVLRLKSPVRGDLKIMGYRFEPKGHSHADHSLGAAVVAGIHGNEIYSVYSAGLLLQALAKIENQNSPYRLKQPILIIPAINLYGINLQVRNWPLDGTDINRMFPGYDQGETTQKIAHAIFQHIQSAKVGVDIHSSGGMMTELTQFRIGGNAPKASALAKKSGIPILWHRPGSPTQKLKLVYQWSHSGTTAFHMRIGETTELNRNFGNKVVQYLIRLFHRAEILDGPSITGGSPLEIHDRDVLPILAEGSGLFIPQVKVGQFLRKNQPIGTVMNPLSEKEPSVVLSPHHGILMTLRANPLIYEKGLVGRIILI